MRAGGKTEEQTRPWLFAEMDRCETVRTGLERRECVTHPHYLQTPKPLLQVGEVMEPKLPVAEEGGGHRQEDDRPRRVEGPGKTTTG